MAGLGFEGAAALDGVFLSADLVGESFLAAL